MSLAVCFRSNVSDRKTPLGWVIWGKAQDCLLGTCCCIVRRKISTVWALCCQWPKVTWVTIPEVSRWTSDEQITQISACFSGMLITERDSLQISTFSFLSATENAFSSRGSHDLKGPLWNFLFIIHAPGWVGLGHWMQKLNLSARSLHSCWVVGLPGRQYTAEETWAESTRVNAGLNRENVLSCF